LVPRAKTIISGTLIAVSLTIAVLAAATAAGTWLIERSNPPDGRFVTVDGGRLHIVEAGPADAPVVVLLHGAAGNLNDLRAALGAKLAARYHVILVDRPGHGWSDRPGGRADATPARQAQLIHQALMKIGVTRAIFAGHSWSGALAPAYALAFPDEVAGLVLLAPVGNPWQGGVGFIEEIAALPVIGPLLARTMVLPAGYLVFAAAVRNVFAPETPPPDYAAQAQARMILRPSEFLANAEDLAVLKDAVTAQSAHYGEIEAPVAIIAGTADTIVNPDVQARALAKQFPQATLTMLPGVGHMVHYAAPGAVIAAVDAIAERSKKPELGAQPR
jgi:pimeloyl-ACP methyl ester carboxylesterase